MSTWLSNRPHARGGEPARSTVDVGDGHIVPTPVGVNHISGNTSSVSILIVPTPVGVIRFLAPHYSFA